MTDEKELRVDTAVASGDSKRLPAILGAVGSVLIIYIAFWFLHRELAGYSLSDIVSHIKSVPKSSLLTAVGFTICSYAVLTAYDAAGLRYIGRDLPYRNTAITSFMAFAVGHNVGIASLSGGSIRYRMYSLAELSALEIARLILFVSATFGLGASGLLGIALLLMPDAQTAILQVQPTIVRLAGLLLLAVPFAYIAVTFFRRAPVRIGS